MCVFVVLLLGDKTARHSFGAVSLWLIFSFLYQDYLTVANLKIFSLCNFITAANLTNAQRVINLLVIKHLRHSLNLFTSTYIHPRFVHFVIFPNQFVHVSVG